MPNSAATIVLTSPDDRQAKDLLRAYFVDIASRYYGRAATDSEIDQVLLEQSSDDLTGESGFLLLALDDQGVGIACAGVRVVHGTVPVVGEVTRVFVSERGRGQGLGTDLLAHIEQHSAARGLARLRLDVRSDLVEAQRLYLRSGYHPVPAFNDSPWAGHWFQKDLILPAV
jgi:ribosomal protein S18 acetylase RimI-like enzyme